MKKLMIIFIGVGMTLVSCKTHLESLASNTSDDVYYNPTKEHKQNVAPQPVQYDQQQQQYYNPNAGKRGATAADQNNPYYKDPNFNYDDYYDNAYAARVKRFQQPLYGTSYYDSYYTNSYFYNQNPSMYGTSIYNSYNMGSSMGSPYGYGSSNYYPGQGYGSGYGGYYSPSQTFNNAFYNPYYSGYGGYGGGGYGSGLSIGMGYGMGYGMGGYNPYGMMGYGCNPYGMGMGYNPYGMGYNPYGMGYGGYSPYGMGMYSSPMYASGYYNSYDYNSSTYHYGPRGSHAGGNSTTNAPMPAPRHRDAVANNTPGVTPGVINTTPTPAVAPYAPDRFTQVSIPHENYIKMTEVKTPSMNGQYQPNYNGQAMPNNNIGIPHAVPNNNYYGNNGTYNGNNTAAPGGYTATPNINNNAGAVPAETKPHRWFSGSSLGDNNNNGFNNNGYQPNSTPIQAHPSSWGGGSSFGGGSSGGGGGHSGGGGGGGHRGR